MEFHINPMYITIMSKPDTLNRITFMAEWIADNTGYSCNELGLRGQMFFTTLNSFCKDRSVYRTIIFKPKNIKF